MNVEKQHQHFKPHRNQHIYTCCWLGMKPTESLPWSKCVSHSWSKSHLASFTHGCCGLLCFLSNSTNSSVNNSLYGSFGSVKVVWTLSKSGIFSSGDINQERGEKSITISHSSCNDFSNWPLEFKVASRSKRYYHSINNYNQEPRSKLQFCFLMGQVPHLIT